MIIKSQDIMR